MTTLRTLENISKENLLDAFNLAFSDYIVPVHLSKEQLEDKMIAESINLALSVGAFEDNQLIAFILHGYDIVDNLNIAYNAGTGVIPAKRGNKLTQKLYEYTLPILQETGIEKVLLEVITSNEPAIKTYKNAGFNITRELHCFNGSLLLSDINSDFEICELKENNWQKLKSFWDFNPSWQNSITAVEKLKKQVISIGIYEKENLLGYTIYNQKTKRIHQLSVDKNHRKMGVGKQLLGYISTTLGKDISITNIDSTSKDLTKFMTGIGLDIYIKQYEMELGLK